MINVSIASKQVLTARREEIFVTVAEARKMSKAMMCELGAELIEVESRLHDLGENCGGQIIGSRKEVEL